MLTHTPSEGSRLGRLFDRGPREHLKWAWADCRMPQSANGVTVGTYESRRGMGAAYCQMKGARTDGSRSIAPTYDDSAGGMRAFNWHSQEWADDAAWLAEHGNNFHAIYGLRSNPVSDGWAAATASTTLGVADAITGRPKSWGLSFSVMCFDREVCHPFSIKDSRLSSHQTGYESDAFTVWTSNSVDMNIYDKNRQFYIGAAQTFTVGLSLVSFFFDGTRYSVRVNGVGPEQESANHPNYRWPDHTLPATLTAGTSMLQMGYFVGLLKNFRIFVDTGLPDDVKYHMDREMERLELFGGHLSGPMLRVKQAQVLTRSFSMQFTVVVGGVSVEGEEATLIQVGDGARGVSLPEVMLTADLRLKACYSTDNTDPQKTACVQTSPLAVGASYGTSGWPWATPYTGSYGTHSRTTISSSAAYRVHLGWLVDSLTGVGRWDTTEHAGGWRTSTLEADSPVYWDFGCDSDDTIQHCADADIRLTWSHVGGTATELSQTQQTWGSSEPVGVPGPLRRTGAYAHAFVRSFKYMPSGLGYHVDATAVSPDYTRDVPRDQRACPWLGLYDEISGVPVRMKSTSGPPFQFTMATTGQGTAFKDNTAAGKAATYTTINGHKLIGVTILYAFDEGSRQHLWNPVATSRAYTMVVRGWSIASRWGYTSSTYSTAWGGVHGEFLGTPWGSIKSAWQTDAAPSKWGSGKADPDIRILRNRRMVHGGLGPSQIAVTLVDTGTSLEFKGRVHHLTNNNGDSLYTHYVVSGAAYQVMKQASAYSTDSIPIGRYYTNGAHDYAFVDEFDPFNRMVGGLDNFRWYDRDVSDVDLDTMYSSSAIVSGTSVVSSYADHPDGASVHYWGMGANNEAWTTPDGVAVPGSTNNWEIRRCARMPQSDVCANGYSIRDEYVDPRDGTNLNCRLNLRYYADGCYQESLGYNVGSTNPSSPGSGISFYHRLPGGVGWDTDQKDRMPTSMLTADTQLPYVATDSIEGCKRECEHVMCRMLTYMTMPGGNDDKTCVLFQTVKSRNNLIRTRWTKPSGGTVILGNERHAYHPYFTPHRAPGDPGYTYTTLVAQHRLSHADGFDETRHFGDLMADQVPENWWKGSASSDLTDHLRYGSVLHWHRTDSEGLKGAYYNEPRGRTLLYLDKAFESSRFGDEVYDQLHSGYHADQKCASICQHINTQANGGFVDRTRYEQNHADWQTPLFCYG